MPGPWAAFTELGCWGRGAFGKQCKLGLPFRSPEVIPEWDERGEGSLGRAKAPGSDKGRSREGRKERSEEPKLTQDPWQGNGYGEHRGQILKSLE